MRKKENSSPHLTKLNSLFEVYRTRLRAPQGSVIGAFIEVVHDLYGITISKSLCAYTPHTRTLTLKARGPLKSEILMRKEEILAHMKGRLGEKSAPTTLL